MFRGKSGTNAAFIGGLWVSKACPPLVTGRSASVRLRFCVVRVVPAVRAGEATLRGRRFIVVLIAGLSRRGYGGVCERPFASFLFSFGMFFISFWYTLCSAPRTCRFLFHSTVLGGHDLDKHFVK